ncbi:S1C family serine protease [Microbacteriaceae bacterium 4G12]
MGYYDQTDVETRYEEKPKQRGKKGYFISGFVGAVIGAVTITVAAPYVSNLSGNHGQVSFFQSNQKVDGTAVPVSQNMKPTDLAGMIQGAKEVVVGVINYQATDPFSNQAQAAGSGSGVLYKKVGNKALIVTNNHVVEGAKSLEVKLSDGTKVPAKLVGADRWLDLAVVEIDGSNVKKIATIGDSDKVRVGETAIAIGNPLGLDGTVTEGIISSKDREIPVDINQDGQPDWTAQVMQTDASINPGNSGGALFNSNGELIGINSSKIAQQAVEGIGFAIPINIAKPVLDTLETEGQIKRPLLGVGTRSLDELPSIGLNKLNIPKDVTGGVLITNVQLGTPAAEAGLNEYDLIVALDNQKVTNSLEFRKYLYNKKKVGDKMTVSIYRNGQKMEKTVTLSATSKQ